MLPRYHGFSDSVILLSVSRAQLSASKAAWGQSVRGGPKLLGTIFMDGVQQIKSIEQIGSAAIFHDTDTGDSVDSASRPVI